MKIIKEGDPRKAKGTKTFECHNCGCIFEADKGEYHVDKQYNWTCYWYECPTCKHVAYEKENND